MRWGGRTILGETRRRCYTAPQPHSLQNLEPFCHVVTYKPPRGDVCVPPAVSAFWETMRRRSPKNTRHCNSKHFRCSLPGRQVGQDPQPERPTTTRDSRLRVQQFSGFFCSTAKHVGCRRCRRAELGMLPFAAHCIELSVVVVVV